MEKNIENIELNSSNIAGVKGEYLIEVLKADGRIEYPFGKEKRKNLILDSFFASILRGYKFGIQSFIQTCRAGNSLQAASRGDTGLVGTLIAQTYKSDSFTASINPANNSISLSRDFIFNTIPGGITEVAYSEILIGSFAINDIQDIATSRFTFPGTLILQTGDRLKVQYTLTIFLAHLNSDVPIVLTGGGLDFTGKIRLSANTTGILSQLSGNNTYIPLGDSNITLFRDFTQNSNTFSQTTEFSNYGRYQNIFGTPLWANNVGFYPSGHEPVNYPIGRLDYTPTGDRAVVTTGALIQTNSSSTIEANYHFSGFSQVREVGGIYLWHHNTGSSYSAIYYKFNTPQAIPANTPVTINLQWGFNRI
jgi:hypothetical protein